jgi:hypothetical protein
MAMKKGNTNAVLLNGLEDLVYEQAENEVMVMMNVLRNYTYNLAEMPKLKKGVTVDEGQLRFHLQIAKKLHKASRKMSADVARLLSRYSGYGDEKPIRNLERHLKYMARMGKEIAVAFLGELRAFDKGTGSGNVHKLYRGIEGTHQKFDLELRRAKNEMRLVQRNARKSTGTKSVADDADRILARLGFPVSVHDLPDFRWGDYKDAKTALRDAIEYWMEGGDIPHTMGSQMLTRIKRYRIRASKSVKARTALAIKKAFGRSGSKPTSTRTDPNGLRLIYSPANQAFLLFWGNPPQRETIYRQHIFQASDLPQLEDDLRGLGLKLVKKNRRLYHIVRA